MPGTILPNAGAKAPNPWAIAGAAKPVEAFQHLRYRYYLTLGLNKDTHKLDMQIYTTSYSH